ncbi:MAG: hypothetical protein R3F61_24495 [Myxococcota bacterium]
MTELVTGSSQVAVAAVQAELSYADLDGGGFSVQVSGASGAFALAVPVAVVGVAVLAALADAPWVGAALVVLALVLVPRTGGRVHGLRVQNGALHVEGPDTVAPLETLQRVDLTLAGITLLQQNGEPIALQLGQSLGARAWLAERIREAIVRHGGFDDVPLALARLRGEEEPDA